MHWLSRIGRDLRQGENLEIYVIIAVATGVSVLGIFNVVRPDVVAAATLATLALLAFSTIVNRDGIKALQRRVDGLTDLVAERTNTTPRAQDFFLAERPAFTEQVSGATSISLAGATLSRTVRDLFGSLERALNMGAHVRVVLIDARSGAAEQAASRSYGVRNDDFYKNRLKPTVDLLNVLKAVPDLPGTLELRLLPFMPSFGLLLLNAGTPNATCYVEIYQHKSVDPNPSFTVDARRDERWYTFFEHQFDILWTSARPAGESDGYGAET